MNPLIALIEASEDRLVDKMIEYARKYNFVHYMPPLREAWRLSISELSTPLLVALRENGSISELDPDENYQEDPLSSFGIQMARNHRARGVRLSMFLGLFKYYRHCYRDLVRETDFGPDETAEYLNALERFFDRLEISFCAEWESSTETEIVKELQENNRFMTNEKNKYLTVFESIPNPVFFLNAEGEIENWNHSGARLFHGNENPGAAYYGNKMDAHIPLVFEEEIAEFLSAPDKNITYERSFDTPYGTRFFKITLSKMLDCVRKFAGIVVILDDLTEVRSAVEERVRREKFQGALEMAGAACHELNQPLQTISANTYILSQECESEMPNQLFDDIIRDVDRMAEITRKLNKITRYAVVEYGDGIKIFDINRSAEYRE